MIFFDLQYKQPYWEVFEPLNRIYNERLSPYDYREPCYRYLIAVPTDPQLDIDALVGNLTAQPEIPSVVANSDGVLVETFRAVESRLADKLRWCSNEIEHLHLIIS